MITIFKNKQDIPQNMEYIELNDLYFVQNTVSGQIRLLNV